MNKRIKELDALIEEIDVEIRKASAEDNVSKYVDLYKKRNDYVREKLKLRRALETSLKESIDRGIIEDAITEDAEYDDIELYKTLLIQAGIATREEIQLVCDILVGCSIEALEAILHVRTGYATFDEYINAEYAEKDYFDEASHIELDVFSEARLSEGLTIEDIAKKHGVSIKQIKAQIVKGIEVEYEHTDDEIEAKKIAMDHLTEIPDYYDRLEEMERSYKDFEEATQVADIQRKTSYPKKTKACTKTKTSTKKRK